MTVGRSMPTISFSSWLAALVFVGCSGAVKPVSHFSAAASRSVDSSKGVAASEIEAPLEISAEQTPITPEQPTGPVMAMAGDPDARALQEVRLVSKNCSDLEASHQQVVEARVREMRSKVAASLANWRAAQPDCWEMYRQQELYWRRLRHEDGYGYSFHDGPPSGYGDSVRRAPAAPASAASKPSFARSAAKTSPASRVRSASGTNNQVAGVDEADLVKHDGHYVYLAANGALRIASIDPPAIVSVTALGGAVKELFVEGNRAVVYVAMGGHGGRRCTYGYDCQFGGDGSRTQVVVFDVSNRTSPRQVRRIELSGSLIAARRIGTAIHTIVADGEFDGSSYSTWPSDLDTCGVTEGYVKQRLEQLAAANERAIRASKASDGLPTMKDGDASGWLCDGLSATRLADGRAFTSVVSFDLTQDHVRPTTATVQSRPGAVFVSESALYLTVTHQRQGNGRWYSFYPQADELSDVHQFQLGRHPAATRYLGSGVVPGHVLNQFAMDEWYGYLRIATTRGHVPNPDVESQVSVLAPTSDGNLVRIGAVEHLAPGEDIRSVRFDEDRGYVVTFKKTDPLFVLDLKRPDRPRVLGELKIPGFSTYIHRIDPRHLLSIGLDANDHGSFAYFDGVLLQLFDVSSPTDPRLIHREVIGTRGSSSEAITNHLAFNYFGERGLLAIPMTICEGGGDGSFGQHLDFSGLLVYHVSVRDGFHRLGGVDHGLPGANCSTWWSNANSAVKRSLFLDNWVWSIALDKAKVQRLSQLGDDVAELNLR